MKPYLDAHSPLVAFKLPYVSSNKGWPGLNPNVLLTCFSIQEHPENVTLRSVKKIANKCFEVFSTDI